MNQRVLSALRTFALIALALAPAIAPSAGCVSKGPAERVGASVDRGVQGVKDAIVPAGPVERAGRSVDRIVSP